MSVLLFAVLFGLGFAFLATQNTSLVTVRLGVYAWTIPIYLVVFGALLVGLLVAWLFNIIDWASSALILHRKDHEIQKAQEAVHELEKKVSVLELENAKLREEKEEIKAEEHAIHTKEEPSIFERLRHRLSVARI